MTRCNPAMAVWSTEPPPAGQPVHDAGTRSDKMSTVDALDRRLLVSLAEVTRPGVLELSRRLGVARGTVQARLDRLQARGVLVGFGPYVDLTALGYTVLAFTTLEIA